MLVKEPTNGPFFAMPMRVYPPGMHTTGADQDRLLLVRTCTVGYLHVPSAREQKERERVRYLR